MRRFYMILIIFIILFTVMGCNQNEIIPEQVFFDSSQLESVYEVGNFQLDDLYLTVLNSDGTILQVPIDESMISSFDLSKLNTDGIHRIEVLYEGFKVSFEINISDLTNELTILLSNIYSTGISEGSITDMTYDEWLESIRGEQGIPGVDGREVLFQVSDGYIQWKYEDEATWTNLIGLETLMGASGNDGREVEFQVEAGSFMYRFIGDELWTSIFSIDLITGSNGTDGREVLFQVSDGHIQWKYEDEATWSNLIDLETLMGATGQNGTDGADGREVLFQVSDGHIQWKYEDEATWTNLIDLETLTGATGQNGTDGADGREVLFQVSDGYIQWKYEDEATWTNLIGLETLMGASGNDGREVEFQVEAGSFMYRFIGDELWTSIFSIDLITGSNGTDGREVLFQVSDGHIQWKYEDEATWSNLIDLETLMGATGQNGTDGREVLFQVSDGHIQWQYEGDVSWNNLIDISTITGISAYELYLLNYPNYSGTELEWLNDLVNGRLADIKQWNVIYDYDDGITDSDTVLVDNLSKIEKPIDPIREGYSFLGWFIDDEKWSFVGFVVTEDITLTAKWHLIDYEISYVLDGGINNVNNLTSYNVTTSTFEILDPSKEGYIFTGWTFTEQEIPRKNLTIEVGSIGDIELTAHWYQLDTSGYNSENTEQDDLGVLDIFYYIEINDDSFLLITTTLYYDGTMISVGDYGLMIEISPNVYELTFLDQNLTDIYILINEEGIFFCDDSGQVINGNEGNNGDGIVDGTNIDSTGLGYGYYNLLSNPNYLDMRTLYEDLLQVNLEIASSINDLNETLIMTVDTIEYGLDIDDALETIKIFTLDHPAFYWLSNDVLVMGSVIKVYVNEAYLNYSHRSLVNDAIRGMIDELESLIDDNMSELEITKIIHDFIILRVDYSYKEDNLTPEDKYWAHNIEGVALKKGAVCEAYAETFDILLGYFGINSILVTGESNSDKHMWNLVDIDNVYYFFDLTFDDIGSESIIYTFFGTSYVYLTDTHNIDNTNSSNLDYLYDLPPVSSENICIVTLYENNEYFGIYVSIDAAISAMINDDSDYIIELFDYDFFGPTLLSTSVREYNVFTTEMPSVNSITFSGKIKDLGNGFFTHIAIILYDNITFNSNIFLDDIAIKTYSSMRVDFDIQHYTLSFIGYHNVFYGRFQVNDVWSETGGIRIVGSEGSTINNLVEYQTDCNADIDIDILNLERIFHAHGEITNINTINNNSGFLEIYKGAELVNIDIINLNNQSGIIFRLFNVEGTEVTIGQINNNEYLHEGYKRTIELQVTDVENMPMITINGIINFNLEVLFRDTVRTLVTDVNGIEISRSEYVVDFSSYGNQTILTAPNLNIENFSFNLEYTIITSLFTKNEEGEFYRDKDFVERIIDGVLVEVSCLNSNVTNSYTIPDSVNTIGSYAFSGFFNLTELIIPNTVVEIQSHGLSKINNISYIFIPNTIQIFAEHALVVNTNTVLLIESSMEDFPYDIDSLIWGHTVVFDFIELFKDDDFIYAVRFGGEAIILALTYDNNSTEIIIPSNINGNVVVGFAQDLFAFNWNITSVFISNTILEIPENAFILCKYLSTIVFEANSSLTTINRQAFLNCWSLQDIYIPSSVNYIAEYAFSGCNLTVHINNESQISSWSPDWNVNYTETPLEVIFLNQ